MSSYGAPLTQVCLKLKEISKSDNIPEGLRSKYPRSSSQSTAPLWEATLTPNNPFAFCPVPQTHGCQVKFKFHFILVLKHFNSQPSLSGEPTGVVRRAPKRTLREFRLTVTVTPYTPLKPVRRTVVVLNKRGGRCNNVWQRRRPSPAQSAVVLTRRSRTSTVTAGKNKRRERSKQ